MKIFKYLAIVCAGIFFISSCQKELSTEGGLTGGFATGTLKDLLDNCQPISLNGTYTKGKTLNDSNTVVVQINFSTPGTYNIFTDTVNGFSFSQTAFTVDTGLQSITLKAAGTPVASVPTDFTVFFDTSFCTFNVPVITDTPAVFTLQSTSTACSNADVQGTYATGTPLLLSNKVVLEVNVSAKGSYNVSTSTDDGIFFKGAGNFTTTGIQTITLQGSGTPVAEGTATIPIVVGGSSCSFDVTVEKGTTADPNNPNTSDFAWQFNQGNTLFHGSFHDGFFADTLGVAGLSFSGSTPSGDSSITFLITMFGAHTVQPGTYRTNSTAFFNFAADVSSTAVYQADPSTPNSVLTIIIQSYNATTKIVTGTFSGDVQNASGGTVPVTAGKFSVKIE